MDDKPATIKDKARSKMKKYERKFRDFIENNDR